MMNHPKFYVLFCFCFFFLNEKKKKKAQIETDDWFGA